MAPKKPPTRQAELTIDQIIIDLANRLEDIDGIIVLCATTDPLSGKQGVTAMSAGVLLSNPILSMKALAQVMDLLANHANRPAIEVASPFPKGSLS